MGGGSQRGWQLTQGDLSLMKSLAPSCKRLVHPRTERFPSPTLPSTPPPSPLQVPGPWDSTWEGPESPTDYCRAVVACAAAVKQWRSACKAGSLLTTGEWGRKRSWREHVEAFVGAIL